MLAADPYEAVERLKISVPGVMVLDVEMPRMDGLTFLQEADAPASAAGRPVHDPGRARGHGPGDGRRRGDRQARLDQCEPAGGMVAEPAGERPQRRAGRAPATSARTGRPRRPIAAIRPMPSCRGTPIRGTRASASGSSWWNQHRRRPGAASVAAGFSPPSPGIVIVQHMPPEFIPAFAQRLDKDPEIKLDVAEARHHEPVRPAAPWSSRTTSTA